MIMPVTQEHLDKAVELAKEYGATRLLLFGSALDTPETANDLDLAVDGIDGWKIFGYAGKLENIIGILVDIIPLDQNDRFTKKIERIGRVLYDQRRSY